MFGIRSADKADSLNMAYPWHGTCVGTYKEHWVLACVLICTIGLQNVSELAQMSAYIR